MASQDATSVAATRTPLSRERVLAAAVQLADEGGLESLTMRGLAALLGVEAMSLYHHVANKDAILDGVTEVVLQQIATAAAGVASPPAADDWQAHLRARVLAAREVMLQHPWAPTIIETRSTMSHGVVLWFEQVLGILHAGGFSYDLAHHALHALGSRALGFNQELFVPNDAADDDADDELLAEMAGQLPHLMAMLADVVHDDPDTTLGWCDDQTEFEFGLDMLLAGLEQRRQQS